MDLFTSAEITQLVILGILLLIGLIAIKVIFRLTMSILRVGCLVIFLIFIGVGLWMFLF